ncbi:MAG: hypothetical protein EA357_02445 [Micavibrio sp.]|nr:MAG: hypothetical protein EA357_02445 [Micavibrio sp.]
MTPRKKPSAASSSLRFDFNKAAAKLVSDFPELRKDAVFIDARSGQYLAEPEVLDYLKDDSDALEDVGETLKLARKGKTSFFQPVTAENDDGKEKLLRTIVFHSDRHTLYDPKDKDIDDTATLDHEAGHALTPNAGGTLGENTADAFALLRHFQRMKGKKTDIDYCGWKRAAVSVFSGTVSHMTTFTVDKILIDAGSADFVSLSPKQTLALSRDYARKHTRNSAALKKLQQDFSAVKGKKPDQAAFRKIARITLKADPKSDTFYIGTRILMTPLRQGTVTLDGKKITLKGTEWDKIRTALEEKTATLPKTHPLRRLPRRAAP